MTPRSRCENVIGFAVVSLVMACSKPLEVHETQEAKDNPCITCHSGAYRAARRPEHVGLFPEGCNDCHSQRAWAPVPNFHDLGLIKAKECVDCHRDVYDKTSAPKHAPLFPTLCKDCHSTKEWRPLGRNIHESDTVKKAQCYDCHKTQYEATTNPKHVDAFPTTCAGCHNTNAWRPATPAPATTTAPAPSP